MMLRKMIISATLVGAASAFTLPEATAWGPEARKAIVLVALQMIKEQVSSAYTAGSVSYEIDVIRGAEDGYEVIRETVPVTNRQQAIDAVGHEISVLRTARDQGTGSYFAYRMGTLAALVSDVILPFGLPFIDERRELSDRIVADLERHVDDFSVSLFHGRFVPINNPDLYFREKTPFMDDDVTLIVDDYTRGSGYNGFLREASTVYFERATDAVADAWYTVFRGTGQPSDTEAARIIMTQYYVNQIQYLLEEKRNLQFAYRTYDIFERVNPGRIEPYLRIGDLFYAYGHSLDIENPRRKDAIDRAVLEWKIAQRNAGPQRERASKRLSQHYIELGEFLFQKAKGPNREDSDLQEAKLAFEEALKFDRRSDIAADRISETTVEISERQDRYNLQQQILAQALLLTTRAEKSRLDQDFSDALSSYNQALSLLMTSTDDEFRDISEQVATNVSNIKKEVKATKGEVFTLASDAIQEGDLSAQNNDYDRAIQAYRRVPLILDVIQAEQNTVDWQQKQDLLTAAEEQISQADYDKERYEQRQNAQQPPAPGD